MEPVNCLRCSFRHTDNGNCTAIGGFCTAVPAAHCQLLRHYEDTGLSPESVEALKLSMMGKAVSEITEFNGLPIDRLRELAEAEKEGRVVVLPCKVGDTAYRLQYIEETPGRYVVGIVEIKFSLKWVADVGKTIFATRKEAELALKEVYDG